MEKFMNLEELSESVHVYILSTKTSKKIRTMRNKWKNHTG